MMSTWTSDQSYRRLADLDHERETILRNLARRDDCGSVPHLRSLALTAELRSPTPPWQAGEPDGCSYCPGLPVWEGRRLPSGRQQIRCTRCRDTFTVGETNERWKPGEDPQDTLDDNRCPLDQGELTQYSDWDGDENGTYLVVYFTCPWEHHYTGEWSAPSEYRPVWEGDPTT